MKAAYVQTTEDNEKYYGLIEAADDEYEALEERNKQLEAKATEFETLLSQREEEAYEKHVELKALQRLLAEAHQAAVRQPQEQQPSQSRDNTPRRDDTPSSGAQKPTKILPDPKKFDQPISQAEGPASTYRIWKHELMRKLETDYGEQTEKTRLNYALTRIDGDTGKAVLSFLEDPSEKIETAAQLFKKLDERYISIYAHENARKRYRDVMQYGRPFEEFLAEFRSLAADARISEQDQRSDFKERLNPTLAAHCVAANQPKLSDMIDYIREISWNVDALVKQKRTITARRTNTAPSAVTTTSTTTQSKETGQKPRLSNEEWAKTQQCFICKNWGHISRHCPKKGDDSPKELPSTKSP